MSPSGLRQFNEINGLSLPNFFKTLIETLWFLSATSKPFARGSPANEKRSSELSNRHALFRMGGSCRFANIKEEVRPAFADRA